MQTDLLWPRRQLYALTSRDLPGSKSCVSITYDALAQDLHIGDRILLDDGLIELKVENLSGADILCSVVTGGVLSDNKSINVPGVNVSLPGLTSGTAAISNLP